MFHNVKAVEGRDVRYRVLDEPMQQDFADTFGDVIPSTDGEGVVHHRPGD